MNEYLILEHPSELYPSIMRLNFANTLLKPTAYSLLNARPKYRILVTTSALKVRLMFISNTFFHIITTPFQTQECTIC